MKKHLLFFTMLLLPLLGMAQVVLEDFEGGAKLPWTALDGQYSVVDNPAGGNTLNLNSSTKVGSYTKKSGAAYSLFLAELPTALDLSTNNLFKIQVKAAVASAFILKLEGTSGVIEGNKNIAVAGEWIEYTFDFSKAAATQNLKKIILFFDPGVDASSDTYLFDNLTMGPGCLGAAPSANILDNFECARNISYASPGFADITSVDNPDKTGINTSDKVGRYKDTGGEYHAMVMDWGGAMPLNSRNVVRLKLWAPVAGNLLVKLEGGTSPAKETPVAVTEVNKWVEYTINFSSQAAANHTKLVLFFNAGKLPGADDVYFIDDITLDPAPTSFVYEDFEGGAKLNWNAADGTFAVVPNPAGGDTLKINGSTTVGSYTKKEGAGYSLFLTELAQPLDLSIYSVFKIQVKSAVATSFLLKLEGPSGTTAIEEKKKIAVKNQWIEYTFNFSKAAATKTFNKIIIFFDPGVDTSKGTYLFDNLIAVSAGDCAGVEKSADILDDFECQRNIAYGDPGFIDISVVDNPDKLGANLSAKVGRYKDTGGEYHALVMDWGGSIPLKDRNQLKLKVWAPVAGNLLLKLEGGTSGAKEISVPVSQLNRWVEYTADFSDQENANHTKIVVFFNAGKLPGADDIYYVDDISLVAPEKSAALEDFEGGAKMFWESLGTEAVFGKFNGEVDNPGKVLNTSATVGSYTKGSSKLGGLKALLPQGFTLEALPQVNLQVWAPAGAKSLTLRLVSASQGTKEINRPIDATGKWVDLNFNFSNFKNVTDFEQVEIVFDPDLTSTATWYFDNLTQTVSTVNLCEGVVAIAGQVDDFECQRNFVKVSDALKVINNPDPTGINSSASDKVGEYTDPKDEWSAIVYEFAQPIDLSVLSQVQVKIWSPKAGPILFKLEGGTAVEVFSEVKAADTRKWVQYSIDFSAAAGKGNTRLAIFFNAGVLTTTDDVYYIDDVELRRAPYTSCISNFETALDDLGRWQYFANGSLDGQKLPIIVDNPNKSGINTSNKVAEFIERPGGEVFAGYFNDALPAVISMGTNKKVTMKVLMDHEADVVLKLERSTNQPTPAPNTGDTKVKYTTPNQWQELTWDFSTLNIPNGALYSTLSIIMDFGTVPTTEKRYYFDDLAIGDKSCSGTVGVRDIALANLKVYPNPVSTELIIENGKDMYAYDVFNALGQKVFTIRSSGQNYVNLNTAELERGMYILAAYDKNGLMKAKSKFIKQ